MLKQRAFESRLSLKLLYLDFPKTIVYYTKGNKKLTLEVQIKSTQLSSYRVSSGKI